ncbi:hypothetical protein [Vagococcus fluvialis]|uniref:hypothetical protein n=1 Tax=Vagococcus fluvialis TaxID=2738 RepID=UPI003B5C7E30
MKKNIAILLTTISLLFLAGCQPKQKEVEKKATDSDSALMYTFNIEEHEYRFRLLDNWIKYPNKDGNITFLVGNKENKSFMTAGVEPVDKSLDNYKDDFLKKISEQKGDIKIEPDKRELNGLPSYYLQFVMDDSKGRPLTYCSYLIETDDYFINLAAWTSEENPSAETLQNLDDMLSNFEQLK